MNRRFSMLICACTTSLLVACGGGSDDGDSASDGDSPSTPADVTDRYEGSWLTACQQDYDVGENPAYPDGKSQLSGLVLRKLTPTTMSFSLTTNEYETADCTGTRVAAFFSRGDLVFDGGRRRISVPALHQPTLEPHLIDPAGLLPRSGLEVLCARAQPAGHVPGSGLRVIGQHPGRGLTRPFEQKGVGGQIGETQQGRT